MSARPPAAFPVSLGSDASIDLRRPLPSHGAAIWSLVRQCGTLDRNSAYLYFLLASDFAATCRLAWAADQPVAFLTAYRLPDRPSTLFVWQVGVLDTWRGKGLAARMIEDVLDEQIPLGVDTLEATVSPDNQPSRALFHGIAARRGASLASEPRFPAEWFPEDGHEDEDRIVIGPLAAATVGDHPKEE
jgi:L-2,4-diaminobutyric acid acetyltransferase